MPDDSNGPDETDGLIDQDRPDNQDGANNRWASRHGRVRLRCRARPGRRARLCRMACDNAVVDAIKLILLIYNNFNIVKKVVKKIERVK